MPAEVALSAIALPTNDAASVLPVYLASVEMLFCTVHALHALGFVLFHLL